MNTFITAFFLILGFSISALHAVDSDGFEAVSESYDYSKIQNDPLYQFIQSISIIDFTVRAIKEKQTSNITHADLSRAIKKVEYSQAAFLKSYSAQLDTPKNKLDVVVRIANAVSSEKFKRLMLDVSKEPTLDGAIRLSALYSTLLPSGDEMLQYFKLAQSPESMNK